MRRGSPRSPSRCLGRSAMLRKRSTLPSYGCSSRRGSPGSLPMRGATSGRRIGRPRRRRGTATPVPRPGPGRACRRGGRCSAATGQWTWVAAAAPSWWWWWWCAPRPVDGLWRRRLPLGAPWPPLPPEHASRHVDGRRGGRVGQRPCPLPPTPLDRVVGAPPGAEPSRWSSSWSWRQLMRQGAEPTTTRRQLGRGKRARPTRLARWGGVDVVCAIHGFSLWVDGERRPGWGGVHLPGCRPADGSRGGNGARHPVTVVASCGPCPAFGQKTISANDLTRSRGCAILVA